MLAPLEQAAVADWLAGNAPRRIPAGVLTPPPEGKLLTCERCGQDYLAPATSKNRKYCGPACKGAAREADNG